MLVQGDADGAEQVGSSKGRHWMTNGLVMTGVRLPLPLRGVQHAARWGRTISVVSKTHRGSRAAGQQGPVLDD